MNEKIKRIAINIGGGYIPGINHVIVGAIMAADKLGWEIYGIHDGFEGLLFPERYADAGMIKLTLDMARRVQDVPIISNAYSSDPFNVRKINEDGIIEEVDCSDELLSIIKKHEIDAIISIVEGRALSILLKLNRKGLKSVCIPKSIENDVVSASLSFGFNSALNYTTETLERIKQAAISSHKIAVVEVPGKSAGWLALQSGIASLADVVLIPELKYDIAGVAAHLSNKINRGQKYGLVIVAEGAVPQKEEDTQVADINSINAMLSPLAKEGEGNFIIESSGSAANNVALELSRLTALETYPMVLGQLVRGGSPTATDRQLGLGYGAGAVRAIANDHTGVMVVYQPPDLTFISLAETINKVRTIQADSLFVKITQELGIFLGKEV